ncbi:MAG: type I restriction-modification system subunit M N-terminal domain-containing protein [Lamprobacter sp.]|uniref:type I restriction-modification system subunit M N-terminal domain-containing protein n=1 Tax=Lamprobacter sp. TaxID=3100796 RepID=UPI002B260A9B|nr:type I restriction-modification system subunit M N-terminal domain-containing protein [Lamprobacter sp.]MEA3641221.1 type I restriction-modification system subunit M N-terminal domain-containing protein [Lamprobacter sp.]
MNVQAHDALKAKIWEIANRLRGPYRPPQYRLVMLPMVVLRRLDCVLAPTKEAVLERVQALQAQQMPEAAMDKLLGKAADPTRKHPLYNTSPYSFERLLGDSENIAPNLVAYINGFSPIARAIFERFKFADQIEKLDASNRLYTIIKAMAEVDLHPRRIAQGSRVVFDLVDDYLELRVEPTDVEGPAAGFGMLKSPHRAVPADLDLAGMMRRIPSDRHIK